MGKKIKKRGKIKFSMGICAYNEEKTIRRLLDFLLKEKFEDTSMNEIIVVASGCTDRTEDVVLEFRQKDKRVKLITEKERRGKASAVNLIIRNAKNKIIVLESADTVPAKGATENLVLALQEPEVGVVGARVVPRNKADSLIGFAVNLQWELHHLISLKHPKAGEMIAFRKSFERIHPKTAVDEALVECVMATQGYKIGYEPKAIVYNKGPDNVRDFLRQRRRIYAGHVVAKKHCGYMVSTYNGLAIIPYLLKAHKSSFCFFIYTPLAVLLEVIARTAGWLDYHFKIRDHSIWKIAQSTK